MAHKKLDTVKKIVADIDKIVEDYILDDPKKYDFLDGIPNDELPQMIVLILMELSKIKRPISPDRLNEKVLFVIEKNIYGSSKAVIMNKIKSASQNDIDESLQDLITKKNIIAKEVKPIRGPSATKYFINRNFFKLSTE